MCTRRSVLRVRGDLDCFGMGAASEQVSWCLNGEVCSR